jgi:hypothetical protein
VQITKWQKPGSDEIRYYISCRFGGAPFLSYRDNCTIDGMWIGKDSDGNAHVYHKTIHGTGHATERSWHLDQSFGLTTWGAWELSFDSCLTKSGRWSEARFMKYDPITQIPS